MSAVLSLEVAVRCGLQIAAVWPIAELPRSATHREDLTAAAGVVGHPHGADILEA
jgi:hypothetical protein